MSTEFVTLVDSNGKPTGGLEKLEAHSNGGQLHLGFSILVFNPKGDLLLQRRASGKYHFAGLWSNSCCGHPRPKEGIRKAASRRLGEEFGFTIGLQLIETLNYQAHDPGSGLTEREWLSVFSGCYDHAPIPDPAEIGDWRWERLTDLQQNLDRAPAEFTPWFHILAQRVNLRAAASAACSAQKTR